MKTGRLAILTDSADLHALLMQQVLNGRGRIACDVVETDSLCGGGGLSWSDARSRVSAKGGGSIDVGDLDVVWWRRGSNFQKIPPDITNQADVEVIDNDCRTALAGMLWNDFHGTWVSDPHATAMAENKLVQLSAARAAGLPVPRTLVSQDPEEIRRFCLSIEGDVVVKSVRGCSSAPTFTTKVTDAHLREEVSMRLSPAIYQECVPGQDHLRVLVLGDEIYAVSIRSEDLDWRGRLPGSFGIAQVDDATRAGLIDVLRRLRLRMGVVDMKLDSSGTPVWLEVNPQGQFLFMQALSGLDLVTPCVTYFEREVLSAAHRFHPEAACRSAESRW
ncbi:RimK family alpha-L-glutamate ligase [Streptomyces triculaminicus]|uniref:RimK family alpha-L-glutamate ligase n=1 Tax=Streptomyces triculaminicus TaxID=2816232 RepID=UPI0037CE8E49